MSSSFAAHLSRRSGRGMGVLGALAVIGALSAGCAESHRSLLRPVGAELARRGLPEIGSVSPSQVRASEAVQKLLASPLSLQAALRIALAQNRRLQAQAEELGVARAALTAATLPPLEASATYHLGTLEIDVLADVLSLLELPGRRQAAHAQLDRARAAVVGHAVRLAAEVEISYGGLQAAMAKVTLRQLHFDAASAAALVQERAHEAGGATELALARKLDQRETARSLLGRAQVELLLARERLGKALGLSGADPQWTVAEAPPVLPASAPALDELEREAVSASTELEMTRASARERAQRAGASRLRRFLPSLAVGAVAETEGDVWSYGPAVRLALPLSGELTAAQRRDDASLRQAQHELYATAVELRSAARSARLEALGAYAEAAQLRDVVVPLRQRILDETVRHYNAMNADPFAVLLAQQALVEGRQLLLEATARYGAAMAQVSALRRGVMPALTAAGAGPELPASSAGPAPAGGHGSSPAQQRLPTLSGEARDV